MGPEVMLSIAQTESEIYRAWTIVEDMAFNTCRINIMERLYQESFIGKNTFNKKVFWRDILRLL